MENSEIYYPNILTEKVSLTPLEINKSTVLESILLKKLQSQIEGKCNRTGLVKPGSLEILQRSSGLIPPEHFDGNVHFQVRFSVQICNPPERCLIRCKVHSVNKMGILAGLGDDLSTSPLMILVSRQHHYDNMEEFDRIKPQDIIIVEVVGKRFELDDTFIQVVGILKEKKSSGKHMIMQKKCYKKN